MIDQVFNLEFNNLIARLSMIGYNNPIVTSGYRTEDHNFQVGGVSNSKHLRGQAKDLVFRDGPVSPIILYYAKLGLNLDIICDSIKNYYHVELDYNPKLIVDGKIISYKYQTIGILGLLVFIMFK